MFVETLARHVDAVEIVLAQILELLRAVAEDGEAQIISVDLTFRKRRRRERIVA